MINNIGNGKRNLVWHEEFDTEKIDRTKWDFSRLMRNKELTYNNSVKHARIKNGKLRLQVNSSGDTYSLPESITTQYKMLFKYGHVEMRACVPFRHGAWPSFWAKSDTPFSTRKTDGTQNWFSEIDIFEVFSAVDYCVPNLHKWGHGTHATAPRTENGREGVYVFKNPANLNNEYHIYALTWDKDYMKFEIDGEEYFSLCINEKSRFVSNEFPDVSGFHDPHYLIINNEVFTKSLPWYPDGSLLSKEDKMPITYDIDWIRLYQNPETDTLICGEKLFDAYRGWRGWYQEYQQLK